VPFADLVIFLIFRSSTRIRSNRRARSVLACSAQSLRRSVSRAFSRAIACLIRPRRFDPRVARASLRCSRRSRYRGRAPARGSPRRRHASGPPGRSSPGRTSRPAAPSGTSGTGPTRPWAPRPRRRGGTRGAPRRARAAGVPVGVLLDGEVPDVPGVAAVVPQHRFLRGGGVKPVPERHANILSDVTDISGGGEAAFPPRPGDRGLHAAIPMNSSCSSGSRPAATTPLGLEGQECHGRRVLRCSQVTLRILPAASRTVASAGIGRWSSVRS
jgi:hypothetical protein